LSLAADRFMFDGLADDFSFANALFPSKFSQQELVPFMDIKLFANHFAHDNVS
jgi:hypothetical protein